MISGLEEKTLYAGIDESNHGRPNEIHAAVFSYDAQDTLEDFFVKPKGSVGRRKAFGEVKQKSLDYSFVLIPKEIRENFQKYGLRGAVVASLLQGLDPNSFGKLEIYLDGDWKSAHLADAQKYSAEVLDISPERISLKARKKADITKKIVYHAHCVATYLYRGMINIHALDKDEHQKKIYLPETYNLLHRPKKHKKPIEKIHSIRINHLTKESSSQYRLK